MTSSKKKKSTGKDKSSTDSAIPVALKPVKPVKTSTGGGFGSLIPAENHIDEIVKQSGELKSPPIRNRKPAAPLQPALIKAVKKDLKAIDKISKKTKTKKADQHLLEPIYGEPVNLPKKLRNHFEEPKIVNDLNPVIENPSILPDGPDNKKKQARLDTALMVFIGALILATIGLIQQDGSLLSWVLLVLTLSLSIFIADAADQNAKKL